MQERAQKDDTSAADMSTPAQEIRIQHDAHFEAQVDKLLTRAEETRMRYMEEYQRRTFITVTAGLAAFILSGGGFGWFLLMDALIFPALLCLLVPFALFLFLSRWEKKPLSEYVVQHKQVFMADLARTIGNLTFHPNRGISESILKHTHILPAYGTYMAEDCFMGTYKGTRLIFSEARLSAPGKNGGKDRREDLVFDGVFVFLELPAPLFKGHTIITADPVSIRKWRNNRWKKLQDVNLSVANMHDLRVLSSHPDNIAPKLNEKIFRELAEIGALFDNAKISVSLFKGKYAFIAIPYARDMFEASDALLPITTKRYASACKKEIEQILSVLDLFHVHFSVEDDVEDISDPAKDVPT